MGYGVSKLEGFSGGIGDVEAVVESNMVGRRITAPNSAACTREEEHLVFEVVSHVRES